MGIITKITGILGRIAAASYSFEDIGAKIKSLFDSIIADANFSAIWNMIMGAIGAITPYIPYILLVFYAVILLFGKKLLPVLRFVAFFAVGFGLGIYFLTPYVHAVLPIIPAIAVGAVAGVVAALLSKLLYILALAGAAGYSVYYVCFTASYLPFLETITKGNMIFSLAAAAVVVALILLLRKYVEMLGFSLLGAWGIATVVKGFYDYTQISVFVGREWLPVLIITAVIGIVGFVVQFKSRPRY